MSCFRAARVWMKALSILLCCCYCWSHVRLSEFRKKTISLLFLFPHVLSFFVQLAWGNCLKGQQLLVFGKVSTTKAKAASRHMNQFKVLSLVIRNAHNSSVCVLEWLLRCWLPDISAKCFLQKSGCKCNHTCPLLFSPLSLIPMAQIICIEGLDGPFHGIRMEQWSYGQIKAQNKAWKAFPSAWKIELDHDEIQNDWQDRIVWHGVANIFI